MAEFASIPCFEQTGLSGQQTVLSSVFDVAAFGQIVAAFKVVSLLGTAKDVSVRLEHSMDMDQWATLLTLTPATTTGLEILSATKFARYIRAVVDTTSASTDQTVTFSLLCIARDIG